jgi:hypothetical protein
VDEETNRLLQGFENRTEMVRVNVGDLLQQKQSEGAGRHILLETLTQAEQISQAMLEELEELRSTLD